MTTIGPTFPAHIAVSQAEVRLVADQTANADASTIKLDNRASKPPNGSSRKRQGYRRSILKREPAAQSRLKR